MSDLGDRIERARAPAASLARWDLSPILPVDTFLSIVALYSLAVSQPILDLLGKNPEFFLARSAPAVDVAGFAVLVAIVIPAVVAAVPVALGKLSQRAGIASHVLLVVLFTAVLFVVVFERLFASEVSAFLLVASGLALGVVVAFGIYRSTNFRFLLRIGAVAPLAILFAFFVTSPASQLFAADSDASSESVEIGNPTPIVMLVFDELPVASLIDENGDLQSERYPGFGRLADDGTWFRNAITNESNTERALPSILTGNFADPDAVATTADYPQNLFTLLGGSYQIDAVEDLTSLCPESVCGAPVESEPGLRQRWRSTLDDAWIVLLHLILPGTLTRDLPPIDESWSDFREQAPTEPTSEVDFREQFDAEIEKGREQQFERFVAELGHDGSNPSFDFAHLILPHRPWEYMPDGSRYTGYAPKGKDEGGSGWGSDEWLVNQAYQRHLLQTEYADSMVARTIAELERTGMYEDTLMIVLSDHGMIFRPDVERNRGMTEDAVGEIAAVPLFIKFPRSAGLIDDHRAELVDIVPTLADVIDVDLPWDPDGLSLLGEGYMTRTMSQINSDQFVFGVDGSEKLDVAQRRIAIFGREGPFGLAPNGTSDLLWRELDSLVIEPQGSESARLVSDDIYKAVDTSLELLPTYIRGFVETRSVDEPPVIVAIAMNGTVVAVTRSYVRDDAVQFQAFLPPSSLADGNNDVDLILVEESPSGIKLSYLRD